MKTTIDIPEDQLREVMQHTGATTKKEAVRAAVADFNRRCRMAALARHLGTCPQLMTASELEKMRETS